MPSLTEIDSDSRRLDNMLSSKASQKKCRDLINLVKIDGSKISRDYNNFIDGRSSHKNPAPRYQEQTATAHYQFAMHCVLLRDYYWSCHKQKMLDPRDSDINYLELAREQSQLSLNHFQHAYEIYEKPQDKKETKEILETHKNLHTDIVQALEKRSDDEPKPDTSLAQRLKRPRSQINLSSLELLMQVPEAEEVIACPHPKKNKKQIQEYQKFMFLPPPNMLTPINFKLNNDVFFSPHENVFSK
jgi:hypothetical protein